MKNLIETQMKWHGYKTPASVLSYIFTVLGTGVKLDNKGFINGNYRCNEVYEFGEPVPLSLYPWSITKAHQPFRKLAGCRDVGFKESVQYFLACLEITPDSVEYAPEWKANIEEIRKILLDTPTIEDEFTIDDMDKFIAKVNASTENTNRSQNAPNSVTKRWFFDVQWSDCPTFIQDEVRHVWGERSLGNDNYIYKTEVDVELFEDYPNIYFWLVHKGVPVGEKVIIHWWW